MGNETPNKSKQVAVVGAGPAGKQVLIVMHSLEELKAMSVEQLVQHVVDLFGERAIIIADRNHFEEQLEELQLTCNELKLQNQVLESFKEEASAQIAELSQELSNAKVVVDEFDPSIKHKGIEYRILGKKFTWKGKEHTVKSLQADKKLQLELIEAKVGFLIEKTDKPADTE